MVYLKLITFFILFFSSSVWSDENQNDLFDMSLQELLNIEVETSSFFKEKLNETPSTVTVFTGKEIERMGVKTLSELYQYIPSFSLLELGDRKTMTVRGTRSLSQVLLLIDGKRMNNTAFGGYYIFKNDIILSNAKQVEIIRGPGSAMYGANAYLAVINIKTHKKQKYAQMRIGNYDQKEISLANNTVVNGFNISIFSEYYKDKDYKFSNYRDSISSGDGSVVTYRTIENATNTKERLDTNLNIKKGNFTLNLLYRERMYSGGSTEDGKAYSKYKNNTKISNSSISLIHDKQYGKDSIKTTIGLASSSFGVVGYSGLRDGHESYSGINLEEKEIHFTSNIKKIISNTNRIIGGIDYRAMKIPTDTLIGNFDSSGNYLGETKEQGAGFTEDSRSQYGVFLQSQIKPYKVFNLTSGIRYDYDSISGDSYSPRLAIVSHLSKTTTTKLIYGEAFRSPSFVELFQDVATVKGNDELKAERVKTYEASIIKVFENTRMQATYYKSFLNKQTEGYFESGKVRFRNKDKDSRTGFELEMQNEISSALTIKSTYSKSIELEKTDSVMSDHMTMASLIINYKIGKFNINLRGNFKEEFEGLDQKNVNLLNTKVEYQATKNSKYFFLVNNLTDKEYLNTTFVRPNFHSNRGQLYSVGAKLKF